MAEFREVTGFSLYECSNLGVFRNKKTQRVLKGSLHYGYVRYTLIHSDTGRQYASGHRLIAMTWISNPENKQTVNHIDRNPSNNQVSNLEWATQSEQIEHVHMTGVKRPVMIIKQYSKTNDFIQEFSSYKKAAEYVSTIHKTSKIIDNVISRLSNCIKGKTKSAYGYKWVLISDQKDDDSDEIWKDVIISGIKIENVVISNKGRIKKGNRIRTLQPQRSGYIKTTLQYKSCYIHVLVARAFVPNKDPTKTTVNHKDGNKTNNAASNLEWCSTRENILHAVNSGLFKKARKVIDCNTNKIYPSIGRACEAAGIKYGTLWSNCLSKNKRYMFYDDYINLETETQIEILKTGV